MGSRGPQKEIERKNENNSSGEKVKLNLILLFHWYINKTVDIDLNKKKTWLKIPASISGR